MDCSTPGFSVHHKSGVCSHSCPFNQWCYPIISSCVAPFSSCSQSFPASGSFPMSRLFTSSGRSIGASASASASILPMNIQGWFPLRYTDLISLLSKGLSRAFFSTTVWKHQFLGTQLSLWSKSHICILVLEKPYLWQYRPLLSRSCLFFSICCLGSSSLLFQGQVSQFCGCSHRPQWFWSPRKWNLSLFPFFPIYLLSSDGAM